MMKMKILMLGNSFTFFNDMPNTLAEISGYEVTQHTQGGAYLDMLLDKDTDYGKKTYELLDNKYGWDIVVLQEQSNAPITQKERFMSAVDKLCDMIRSIGARPMLYATWAYENDGKELHALGYEYDDMFEQMYKSYHEAAEKNNALIADVGKAFHDAGTDAGLYDPDSYHPSAKGSHLAAEVIKKAISNANID